MKKLKLDVDALAVESCETERAGCATGTVLANAQPQKTTVPLTVTTGPTIDVTSLCTMESCTGACCQPDTTGITVPPGC